MFILNPKRNGVKTAEVYLFLHIRSFSAKLITPPSEAKGAVMSDEDSAQLKADCAFLYYVRNAQRCKRSKNGLLSVNHNSSNVEKFDCFSPQK
jgi:hypothetical protein